MALAILLFNPYKIGLNPQKDLFRFTLAKFRKKPFGRLSIILFVIATIYTMTEWNDVSWDRAGATRISQRYPMVSRKGMPKSRRSAANRATALEIIKTSIPVGINKFVGRSPLSGSPSLDIGLIFGRIISPPLFVIVRIITSPIASNRFSFIWIVLYPFSLYCVRFISVIVVPSAACFKQCSTVFLMILFRALEHLVFVIGIVFVSSSNATFFAPRIRRAILLFIETCEKFGCFTLRTAFRGMISGRHGNSTPVSHTSGRAPTRRRGFIISNIIPQNEVGCA